MWKSPNNQKQNKTKKVLPKLKSMIKWKYEEGNHEDGQSGTSKKPRQTKHHSKKG